jgi:hypothetical protein
MVKVDQEVDRLYSLQIEEFVAARNELSRRLKNVGDTSAADEVKQLVKPNVAAWTINQLSRQLGPIKDSFPSPIGELRGWSAAMPAALDGRLCSAGTSSPGPANPDSLAMQTGIAACGCSCGALVSWAMGPLLVCRSCGVHRCCVSWVLYALPSSPGAPIAERPQT